MKQHVSSGRSISRTVTCVWANAFFKKLAQHLKQFEKVVIFLIVQIGLFHAYIESLRTSKFCLWSKTSSNYLKMLFKELKGRFSSLRCIGKFKLFLVDRAYSILYTVQLRFSKKMGRPKTLAKTEEFAKTENLANFKDHEILHLIFENCQMFCTHQIEVWTPYLLSL